MSLVSAAKPRVGGGVYIGDVNATLPVNATSVLSSAFKSLGFISDAGVTRSISKDNTTVNAWGGQVVAVLNNAKTETFKFRLIEADNLDALGLVFGEASGALDTGITIKSTSDQGDAHSFIINSILAGDVLQRIVIPYGVVTDIGDIVYVDNDVVGFDITITSIADSSDVTAYEYLYGVTGATGATGATGETGA